MVAFSTADLPASVNTVEKLAVWAGMVLNSTAKQVTVQEIPNVVQPVAVQTILAYQEGGQFKDRAIIRVSVELDPVYTQGSTKLWTHALNVSTSAIPTGFRS
jgi:hypothetical protein